MVRALFGGNCKMCRSNYEPYDLVFPWRGGFVCVPCQRYLNDAYGAVS
jgi:hypothetical protein